MLPGEVRTGRARSALYPVFIPKGDTRTLAELPLDEKLRVSATGQGYAELRQRLKL